MNLKPDTLTTFTVSADVHRIFHLDVVAPDPNTALELARTDWNRSNIANWTACGSALLPDLTIAGQRECSQDNTRAYVVGYAVTDYLEAEVRATSAEEALRIAAAMRFANGSYEGSFDVTRSESSDIEIVEVRS